MRKLVPGLVVLEEVHLHLKLAPFDDTQLIQELLGVLNAAS